MYRLQAKSQRIIFSHETSLYLHELTDRDPLEWSVTIPRGYNGSNLREEGIKVYTVKKGLHLLGVTQLKTLYGRTIKVYDKERNINAQILLRNYMLERLLERICISEFKDKFIATIKCPPNVIHFMEMPQWYKFCNSYKKMVSNT